MHVYFSGIGGTAISALAVIAKQAGYQVSGSDARDSQYLDYLRKHGITDLHVGVDKDFIATVHAKNPIDWFVYGSAQPMDFPNHPEFAFCDQAGIKKTKRDEFLGTVITDKKLKLIAIAGTHGKSTTTAMAIWVFKQLGLPISYSGGAKISFGDLSHLDPASKYFVYEADEFDRNFLSFSPEVSLITGVDWDHPDIYPTRQSYLQAFNEFLGQSKYKVLWLDDAEKLGVEASKTCLVMYQRDPAIDEKLKLAGHVNRLNGWLVAQTLQRITGEPLEKLLDVLNKFPGLSRRFEQIVPGLYSDYAHTPPKIRGALQLAEEIINKTRALGLDAAQGSNEHQASRTQMYGERGAQVADAAMLQERQRAGGLAAGQASAAHSPGVVVVYEGLHNTRQHFIKAELANLFDDVKQLYVVPTYLAREDPKLKILTPADLLDLLSNKSASHAKAAKLNKALREKLIDHLEAGDTVLCLSAGSGGSLDEWLRKEFTK